MMSTQNEGTGFFSFLKGRRQHVDPLPEEIQTFFPKRIQADDTSLVRATEAMARDGAVPGEAGAAPEETVLERAVPASKVPVSVPDATAERPYEVEDPLTMIPNRRAIEERLRDALAIARRSAGLVGLIFIDINDFKQINDTYGHQVGDAVLKEAAQRMKRAARMGETIGRFGGDEFVAVYPSIRSQEELAAAANRQLQVFNEPIIVGSSCFKLSASIGAVMAPIDGETSEDLFERVDAAMYRAKNLGKSEVCWYNAEIDEELRSRREFLESFGETSVLQQLFLAYQPIYDTESNEIVAAEALLRWQHPTRGLLTGQDILGVVDVLPASIERWISAKAIATAADWKRRDAETRISINLFNVGAPAFESLVDSLKAARVEPASLNVEIDERTFLRDRQQASSFARDCAKAGIGVALDNFSGALSLAEMNRLPISSLKFSRSLVHAMRSDANARAIADAGMLLAKSLRCEVIATGVERREEYLRLRSMGIRFMQGYAKGIPAASPDFTTWLVASTSTSGTRHED